MFGTTQRFVAGSLQVLILLYFLLAAGDLFLQKLVKVLPQLGDKRTAVQIARKAESSISTYLITAMAVNVGEGIVVAIVLYLLRNAQPGAVGSGRRVAGIRSISRRRDDHPGARPSPR